MHDPALSVVIPVFNGEATLQRCLSAVFASDFASMGGAGAVLEVIAVDDGSTDRTGEILARHPVKVVRQATSHGAAAARNAGAARATAEVVCFLDADVVVDRTTLPEVLRSFEDPGCDGVVGMLSAETEPTNFASRYENLYMHFMYLHHDEEMDIFYTSLAAIRRSVFEASGGFDEAYSGAGIEDMELGQRLVRAGKRLRLNKKLQVIHLKRFGWSQLLRINRRKASGTIRIMLRNRAARRAGRKHVGPDWSFLLGIPGTILALLALVAAALGQAWAAFVSGVLLIGVAALNLRFLRFLRAAAGTGFLLAAIPFFYVQFVNYGVGLAHGTIGYVLGDKH
jgi:glycosyltransferase involved in cell wall biosynthesis